MKPLRITFVAVSLLAAIAGLMAAQYWFKASRVSVDLDDWESVDKDMAQDQWTAAILTGISKSSDLNAKAALWTAVAVLLGAVAAILSAF